VLVLALLAGRPIAGERAAAALRAQAPMRVMSFNLRYGTANDGAHRWPERRGAVVATIRDHAPHLLGVQEALRSQLDDLGAALPAYEQFGVGRDDGRAAGEHAAILVDTARIRVLGSGTFWLSDTPERPGSRHWGNRITRITTWVHGVDRATGDSIRVFNVHWDHESQASRERSAELLLARMEREAPKASRRVGELVLGDFNADESNPAFRRLIAVGTGMRDSFRDRHPRAEVVGTFHGFTGDSTGGKIDAVLVSESWEVIDAGMDRRRWGALWASDHFAVWATLRWR
jgi:endonuclease/exonuclease/phosphatase family metal-dependent hydrolase